MKKTAKGDVLPNCLQVTDKQLFVKSPLEGLIMLWRLPISSTTSFSILSHLKQSGIHSNRITVKKKHPLLKKTHRLECLKFARYNENWTVEDCKSIL